MISATDMTEARWWRRDEEKLEEEDPNAHRKLMPYVTRVRRAQEYRKRAYEIHASLYGNMQLLGLSANAYARPAPSSTGSLSLNVVKNMTDAVVSKVAAKSRPKVAYVTEGGDFDEQENALQLERGVEGVFYQEKFYRKSRKIMRDATIFGTGVPKIYADHDEHHVAIDRIFPWEILVDDQEAVYGEPRTIVQGKSYDRAVARELFPESADLLLRTERDREDVEYAGDGQSDIIRVFEAWHLPSGADATDGRRTVIVENATLEDVRWKGKRFPFPTLHFSEPLAGFWGIGLAEDLAGIQSEINKLLRQIQRGQHLICGHYLIENSSKIVSQHVNNDLAAIVKYTGTRPEYHTPSIIAPEVYQHLWNLYARAYEISAINQMTAQSQKPAGIVSGVAQREYADQQTERFLDLGQRFEEWVEDCASHVVECAKELAAEGSYEVRAPNADDAFDRIDWKDLEDPDGFMLRVHPVSQLPGTPSGKIQYAQDMNDLGVFSAEDIMETIQMPDTKAITQRKLASRRLVEKSLARMIKTGKYEAPEPFQNLDECIVIGRDAYLLYREKNVRDDRLQLVRDYVLAAFDEKKKLVASAQPATPQPSQNAGPPAGAPVPPAPPGPMGGGGPNPMPPSLVG